MNSVPAFDVTFRRSNRFDVIRQAEPEQVERVYCYAEKDAIGIVANKLGRQPIEVVSVVRAAAQAVAS